MINNRNMMRGGTLQLLLVKLVSVLIAFQSYHSLVVQSLSISSSSNMNKLSLSNSNPSRLLMNNSYQQQNFNTNMNLQTSQVTTMSPMMMTNNGQQQQQSNYGVDSSAYQKQQQNSEEFNQSSASSLNEQQSSGDQQQGGSLAGSTSEDSNDSVPLATVNNHSRNNQHQKPSQYVDVSALVGRDRNLSNSGFHNSNGAGGGGGGVSQMSLSGGSASSSGSTNLKSRSGLPECATQQVCNAIFVRMNYTQKLCECSSNYNWKCSNNLDPQDGHTIELTRKFDKRIYTQIKTCEPLREVRACKSPTDWTLLALQSERSGKAHYVVVCKCPTWAQLEGPYTHNHPPYANIPGIRVYGMLCAHQTARSSAQTYAAYNPALSIYPEFPWSEALNVLNTTNLASTIDSH